MKPSKRTLSLFFMALVVLFASVFSFGGNVHAQSLDEGLGTSPLRSNEPVIQQISLTVAQKQDAIGDQTDQIVQLLQKKQDLSQQLTDIQKDVADLNQKIADKKAAAAAEQARIEALKNMFVHINRYAFDSSGNTYAWGNCTWYAKSRRPDASNSWGNANTWYYTAAAQGWSVGSTPKKGAIATTTQGPLGHVAYVEGVTPDGLWVTISEMNYKGLDIISSRTVFYTEFRYIYELD